jgi:adenylate cyclase
VAADGDERAGGALTPSSTFADATVQQLSVRPPLGPTEAAILVTGPDAPARTVAVHQRLFVGRACFGIDDDHRLLLDGPNISRDHCQIRLDAGTPRATLVDTSTNGTRLNGVHVERSVPIPIADGDVVGVGNWSLIFRTRSAAAHDNRADVNLTIRQIDEGNVCVVCGDLVDYTTLTELHGGQAVFAAMHTLFDHLRVLLHAHRGTLYDYVGDAFLAIWEEDVMPDATRRGLDFAVAAAAEIASVAPEIPLRTADGGPLRMGWAVTRGPVAMSAYAGALAGLLGDAVNVGFRLASMAGRQGRSPVLVTEDAVLAGALADGVGVPEVVTVKGRTAPVPIRHVPVAVTPDH